MGSRYYSPEIGRFISADSVSFIGANGGFVSYNLFAYCENDPVNRTDEGGNLSLPNWAKIAIGVGAVIVGAVVVATTCGAAAAFTGAVIAGLKGAAISGVVGAVTGAVTSAINYHTANGSWCGVEKAVVSGIADGFANGFMWGGISYGASHTLGYVTSKTGMFKRDFSYSENNFFFGDKELTIWRHGKNFRIDASASLGLHYHLRTATRGISYHRTKWIQEIIGGFAGVISANTQ